MKKYIFAFLIAVIAIVWAKPGLSQELYALGGGIKDAGNNHRSYTWVLEYMQGIGTNAAFSVSWFNEGHLPDNHRDGVTAQLWGRMNLLHRRFSLAAGIGPYFYYDTKLVNNGMGFSDTHGVGVVASIAGIWYSEDRWLFQVRANWIEANRSLDTVSVMGGIGYQLDAPPVQGPLSTAPAQQERTPRNEITAFIGQTIVNSYDSPQSTAQSLEYRRGLARYCDATIAWFNEGDNRILRRNGLIAQIWAVREFFDDRLSLGIGVGPYLRIDNRYDSPPLPEQGGQDTVAGMVSLTAGYRVSSAWALRLSWSRIATNYNRDTDVIMIGPGYRF